MGTRYRGALVCALLSIWGPAGFAEVNEATVLDTLRPEHPRLMMGHDDLSALKTRAETDPRLQAFVATALNNAEAVLAKPPLEHKLIGPRLLSVSRECVARIYALGLAWRWTGDKKYARGVEANLLTVSAFPDWNPSHFLDTAEMSHGVGVGYDWIFDELSITSRETIKNALIEMGLKPGLDVYASGKGWPTNEHNWNQVCNGGMIVGALAIAETDPEYARQIVPLAVASLPRALHTYEPDGAWSEGPAYWHYATRYTAYGIGALDSALGTDFGLGDNPGLRVSGHFPDATTGPTGLFLNYADSSERSARKPMPCMFWLARKFGDDSVAAAEHAIVTADTADPLHVIWYVPPPASRSALPPLDRHFRGPVDVFVMRSAWNNPGALFVGVKGGYNQVNHGHLDLGNFELDALGVRWARDLGSDDYNLPGYWDRKPGGNRWNYYRLNSKSHNVVMINGAEQHQDAVAKIVRFTGNTELPRVSIDLSSAYSGMAARATRDVAVVGGRRAVIVRDRFEMSNSGDVVWGMTTDAAITPDAGGSATLTLGGKTLIARVLEPKGAVFSAESAKQAPPEKTNEGVNRLVATVKSESGPITLTILLAPVWEDGPLLNPDLSFFADDAARPES